MSSQQPSSPERNVPQQQPFSPEKSERPKLSLVIPVFNEQATIAELHRKYGFRKFVIVVPSVA